MGEKITILLTASPIADRLIDGFWSALWATLGKLWPLLALAVVALILWVIVRYRSDRD